MLIVDHEDSNDGLATKYTQQLADGNLIETVYVNYHNKHIICYSTQVGCQMGCKFCYVGMTKHFVRNLTASEIVEQIRNVWTIRAPMSNKPILLSAMGTGEPLRNYDNYVESMKILHEEYPKLRFALASTCDDLKAFRGLINASKGINFKLTISLHFTDGSRRKSMMPGLSSWRYIENPIKCMNLWEKILNRPVELNYVLMKGINDTDEDAYRLADVVHKAVKPEKTLVKLNAFNTIPGSSIEASDRLKEFTKILEDECVNFEYYETNGSDIYGACGQLLSGVILGG